MLIDIMLPFIFNYNKIYPLHKSSDQFNSVTEPIGMLPFPMGNLEILTYIATSAAVAQLTTHHLQDTAIANGRSDPSFYSKTS